MKSPCNCNHSGFCQTHKRIMSERQYHLCQRDRKWFDLFESISAERHQEKQFPSLRMRVLRLILSFISIAISGFALCEKQVYTERRSKCNGCEFSQNNWCRSCGCYIPLKAWFASEYCPERRWGQQKVAWAGYQFVAKFMPQKSCGCSKPKPTLPIINQES